MRNVTRGNTVNIFLRNEILVGKVFNADARVSQFAREGFTTLMNGVGDAISRESRRIFASGHDTVSVNGHLGVRTSNNGAVVRSPRTIGIALHQTFGRESGNLIELSAPSLKLVANLRCDDFGNLFVGVFLGVFKSLVSLGRGISGSGVLNLDVFFSSEGLSGFEGIISLRCRIFLGRVEHGFVLTINIGLGSHNGIVSRHRELTTNESNLNARASGNFEFTRQKVNRTRALSAVAEGEGCGNLFFGGSRHLTLSIDRQDRNLGSRTNRTSRDTSVLDADCGGQTFNLDTNACTFGNGNMGTLNATVNKLFDGRCIVANVGILKNRLRTFDGKHTIVGDLRGLKFINLLIGINDDSARSRQDTRLMVKHIGKEGTADYRMVSSITVGFNACTDIQTITTFTRRPRIGKFAHMKFGRVARGTATLDLNKSFSHNLN